MILVRHGQYIPKDDHQVERLTELGRQQAWLAGDRLKENLRIDRITQSSMPRAIETARIIKEQLGYVGTIETCEDIRECVPPCQTAHVKKYGYSKEKMKICKSQIDRAFKKHFKMPRKNSVEVLICHGNLIRSLVCRVLEADELLWTSLDILQGSITTVELRSAGIERKLLIGHNDVGHIPKDKRTFL